MKRIHITVPPTWENVPAWDFGAPGLALFRRPDEPLAAWNIIHLASGLALLTGMRTREEAVALFTKAFPAIDWTQSRDAVLRDWQKGAT